MNPKEKAEELFYKMSTNSSDEDHHCNHYVAKNCALIAVDEVLRAAFYAKDDVYDYYMEVKLEIDKL